ncbi:MAG: Wzz/FepE/Etk N-terminal domain-containing protein [Clostridia bacterium]|nr:Wzz/FepE/Etk N-terminal domain-containing protein [Clostridia bacterium]
MADTHNELKPVQEQTAPAVRPAAQPQSSEMEIDLLGLFFRLLERSWIIILAALIGAVIMGVYSFKFITPLYQATSKIYIVGSDAAISISDLQLGSSMTQDYLQVFKNWQVHELVNQRMGTDYPYSVLSGMVSVSNPSGTHILVITVTSSDPQEAMDLANTYANVGREFIASRMDMREPTMFEQARLPVAPVSPNKTKNIISGFLIGALLAAAVITILFLTDDKVQRAEDLTRQTGMPILGYIPMQDRKRKHRSAAVVYGRPTHGKEDVKHE